MDVKADTRDQKPETRKCGGKMSTTYKDLIVYKKAYNASLTIHKASLTFPSFESYELGGQIRRASKSIPMNIAEGYGRNDSLEDFKRFLTMALGSCEEVKVQLDYCKDLGYITKEQYEELIVVYAEISKMIVSMRKNWTKTGI
jgi:four helix bundle protein